MQLKIECVKGLEIFRGNFPKKLTTKLCCDRVQFQVQKERRDLGIRAESITFFNLKMTFMVLLKSKR